MPGQVGSCKQQDVGGHKMIAVFTNVLAILAFSGTVAALIVAIDRG